MRGFILSHLLNLQETSAPHKENLRYLLESISLPSNFTTDVRMYSRNIDLSYYAPTFGVGAGMESNVIYAPGSFIPRSLNVNLTAALGATPINIGEIGARLEGMEPVLEHVFGPEGYIQKTPINKIFQDISSFTEKKITKIMERLQNNLRQKRSIDLSTISHFLDKIYGNRQSKMPKADIYARINDQEMIFASLAGDLKNINVDHLIDSFFDQFEDILRKVANTNVDSVRTAQMDFDYYLPTMQGIPLKMKLQGTTVVGLKMETRFNGLIGGSSNVVKFIPSVSVQVDGFVGFDYHIAQAGIKMKNRMSTNNGATINVKASAVNGFELEIDLPEKMELINIRSETYLMKAMMGQQETKIVPQSVRTVKFQSQSCIQALEPMLGMKVCYDVNMPNILLSQGLPLGEPTVAKVFLQKSDSSMRGYHMKTKVENANGNKVLKIEVEAPGSSTPRKAGATFAYTREQEMGKISCVLQSQASGGIKLEFKHKWTQAEKLLELDVYASSSGQFSPETKAIEAKFNMVNNGQEINVDAIFKTLNAMKIYIDINIEGSSLIQKLCFILKVTRTNILFVNY